MLRFHLQNAVKSVFRMIGCEVRYSFQYPHISDRSIYAPWLDGDRVRTILDVGANIGQSCVKFAAAFPNSTVHSFEPFTESYTQLAKLAQRSHGRIRAYRLACGEVESTIRACYDPTAGSQLQRLDGSTSTASAENSQAISVVTLDRWCEDNQIESIDILKTDTEGYDAKVLLGAQRLLKEGHVKCVVSEVGFHGDSHHTQLDTIYPFLSARGFAMAGIFEITYRRDRTCDFANAMFVHVGKSGAD